ncbi:MAG: DUF488 family protein [Alphaproteobacteria bacterium]|nr:DUF488 family protein [Alphaproteobacteria bacterium]
MARSIVRTKRVYDEPSESDGQRILVERLWPRGVRKEDAHIDLWAKEVSPSPDLRKWYGHEPAKWAEFQKRYRAELDKNAAAVDALLALVRKGPTTLIYSARDEERNSAGLLAAYLQERL